MGHKPKKYHISDNGDVFKVNEDGSFTEMGNAENFQESQLSFGILQKNHASNVIAKSSKAKSRKLLVIIGVLMIIIFAIIGSFLFMNDYVSQGENKVSEANPEPLIASDIKLQGFIESYYHSILDGNALNYFADNNVTFFDLVNVDKSKIKKRLDHSNKNVSFDFDWSTLISHELENGDTMYVYSFDYYIHRNNKTDKYRITSEMIVSHRRKIKSIRDLQTTKISN